MVGKTISHYQVLEKIGEGVMCEVYRATDTKLNRDVALKILPQQFTSDSQRMDRFQREAEVLALLSHANIGHIYGIEDAGATKALVLELIEGSTLAAVLREANGCGGGGIGHARAPRGRVGDHDTGERRPGRRGRARQSPSAKGGSRLWP